ncbi:MAG: hypothetical protein KZQ65_01210 [Candidatus Thiodiazotropha sp. (ex Gloverina cf. vestifex)]|nr:hypothetical protein [Candidatus Thiodiazotropha sp. (ex Gloverina cf. vestifex)]
MSQNLSRGSDTLRAAVGAYDLKFYVVQGLELVAGAVNLTLMGMNVRDGLKLAGKLQPKG